MPGCRYPFLGICNAGWPCFSANSRVRLDPQDIQDDFERRDGFAQGLGWEYDTSGPVDVRPDAQKEHGSVWRDVLATTDAPTPLTKGILPRGAPDLVIFRGLSPPAGGDRISHQSS